MESTDEVKEPYVVPRYRAEGDPAWYHVLHGTVPGHQIDFMYCPDVPQARLTQTHFGHLSRLMKYIEPRHNAPYAFALGNLSRDDVQYEPGHGGLALIFALRVAGVTDHAGRAMPPYAHGVLAVDRTLDYVTLLEAISVFYRRFLDSGPEVEDATGSFYRAYVRVMDEQPRSVDSFLHDYVADFDELPQPPRSRLGFEWECDEEALPKRVTIVHADDEPFSSVAHVAASLGAILYKSNIKWTTITSGREIEIPGGISIRLVPASEAPRDAKGLTIALEDLPDDEAELALKVLGAKPRTIETKVVRAGWRETLAAQKGESAAKASPGATPAFIRHSSRPPAGPSSPPPHDAAAEDVSFDEAATIPAPLERDPAASGSVPVQADPTAAFDPRRSSPTKGVAVAFHPLASSSATNVPAIPAPRATPSTEPAPTSRDAGRDLTYSDRPPTSKSRLGMWIGILGGLAVVIAIVAAIASSSGGTESAMPSGMGSTGTSNAVPGATPPATSAIPTADSTAQAPSNGGSGAATPTATGAPTTKDATPSGKSSPGSTSSVKTTPGSGGSKQKPTKPKPGTILDKPL